LSPGRGYRLAALGYTAAYILPGALFWMGIALTVRPLVDLPVITLGLAALYAAGFGIAELFGIPIPPPSLGWQVPSGWVNRRGPGAVFVWGTLLGPGLVTRNPYAGIWLLPLFLGMQRSLLVALVVGLLVGVGHGAARAVGVLVNMADLRRAGMMMPALQRSLLQLRWRFLEGAALLLTAGGLSVELVRTWR
jgi:hypothetical protein